MKSLIANQENEYSSTHILLVSLTGGNF